MLPSPSDVFGSVPRPTTVLLVSSNERLRQSLRERLGEPRWSVRLAGSGSFALEDLSAVPSDLLLLDPRLPDLDAGEFHDIVREQFPTVQIVTVHAETGQMVMGTSSPTLISRELVDLLQSGERAPAAMLPGPVLRLLRNVGEPGGELEGMVGSSAPMLRVYHSARMVARRDTSVLITGESGTGKDLVARAIHLLSPRQRQPFVVINCAAIPEALLEAELFGYTKGAFTGAVQSRIGRIHAAHGGTLFLDEIGEMPFALQSKLLRFLEQGEVQRIGGSDTLKVDVRVVAATNADLRKLAEERQFREDLFYRLAVFPIHLPALRQRMEDLPALISLFLDRFCPGVELSREASEALQRHTWPGNVRELRNVVERASILAETQPAIEAEHILL